jgi:hypothetical protein
MFPQIIDRDLLLLSQCCFVGIAKENFHPIRRPVARPPPNKIRTERRLRKKRIHIEGLAESKDVESLGESIGPSLIHCSVARKANFEVAPPMLRALCFRVDYSLSVSPRLTMRPLTG